MNLCGSCKFWGTDADKEKFRQCTKIIHDEDRASDNEWDSVEDAEYAADDPERHAQHHNVLAQKAVTIDGSGYFAALKCREDFGCVYHETRPLA